MNLHDLANLLVLVPKFSTFNRFLGSPGLCWLQCPDTMLEGGCFLLCQSLKYLKNMRSHQNQDRCSSKITTGLVQENVSPDLFSILQSTQRRKNLYLDFSFPSPNSSLKDIINTTSYETANTCQTLPLMLYIHWLWPSNNLTQQWFTPSFLWRNWDLWDGVKILVVQSCPSGWNPCFSHCLSHFYSTFVRMWAPDSGLSTSMQMMDVSCPG